MDEKIGRVKENNMTIINGGSWEIVKSGVDLIVDAKCSKCHTFIPLKNIDSMESFQCRCSPKAPASFTQEELKIISRGLYYLVEHNRSRNLSDFSDESKPVWDLRDKIAKLY